MLRACSWQRRLLSGIGAAHLRLEALGNRLVPGSGNAVFECQGLAERILQDLVEDERPQTPDRIHDDGQDRGNAVTDRRLDARVQVLSLVHQIHLPVHGHLRRRPLYVEIHRAQPSIGNGRAARDAVEGKAPPEQVAEIERDPGLHAENADQPRYSRLGLEKLTILRVETQSARKRGIVDRLRASGPAQVPFELRGPALHCAGKADPVEIFPDIADLETDVLQTDARTRRPTTSRAAILRSSADDNAEPVPSPAPSTSRHRSTST